MRKLFYLLIFLFFHLNIYSQQGWNWPENKSEAEEKNVLYTDYVHLFQLCGMILLISMIGAIVLTFRKREGIKKQSYFKQISREKKDGVELVEVKNKIGVKIDD